MGGYTSGRGSIDLNNLQAENEQSAPDFDPYAPPTQGGRIAAHTAMNDHSLNQRRFDALDNVHAQLNDQMSQARSYGLSVAQFQDLMAKNDEWTQSRDSGQAVPAQSPLMAFTIERQALQGRLGMSNEAFTNLMQRESDFQETASPDNRQASPILQAQLEAQQPQQGFEDMTPKTTYRRPFNSSPGSGF